MKYIELINEGMSWTMLNIVFSLVFLDLLAASTGNTVYVKGT